jgi:hypothetical protein
MSVATEVDGPTALEWKLDAKRIRVNLLYHA